MTDATGQAVLLAGQATDLRYGRDAELEADQRGRALLVAAGLSSHGMRDGAKAGAAALLPSEWAAVRASCGEGSRDPVAHLKDRLRRRGDKAPVDQGDQVRQD